VLSLPVRDGIDDLELPPDDRDQNHGQNVDLDLDLDLDPDPDLDLPRTRAPLGRSPPMATTASVYPDAVGRIRGAARGGR
jgi:hypothetical protein